MPTPEEQPQTGGIASRAAEGAALAQGPSRPDAGVSQIDNDKRSLAAGARALNRGAAVRDSREAAEAKAVELPIVSPFYREEAVSVAAARLRRMLDTGKPPNSFTEEVTGLRTKSETKAEREKMRYGVVVVGSSQHPKLVGWGLDDMICIGSMAKLAILYACFQLRADCEVILRSGWEGTAASPAAVAKKATQIVAGAFRRAKDPALRAIGSTPANMPVLERIFDLDGFLGSGAKGGSRQLVFKKQEAKVDDVDDAPFYNRLIRITHGSDNDAATSLIADIGLPYIKALLTRSGLADVSGPKKGLWLASTFGYLRRGQAWPKRKGRLVNQGVDERSCEKQGSEKGKGTTGQGGTVRAIATFYELLRQGQLVDTSSSVQMRELLDTKKKVVDHYLVSALESKKTVIASSSKIGILLPWHHDSAMITSTAPRRSGTGIPETETPIRTWIAVALLGNSADPITKIAPEMERAVQNYMLSLAMRAERAGG